MKVKHILIAIVLGVLFLGGWYYVAFPVISIHQVSFWGSVIWVCIVLGVIFLAAILAGSILIAILWQEKKCLRLQFYSLD